MRPLLDRGQIWPLVLAGLRGRETSDAELGGSNGHSRSAEKSATMLVDIFGRLDLIHS